jgi:hypothetical protein
LVRDKCGAVRRSAHSRDELVDAERLRYEVVGATAERFHFVLVRIARPPSLKLPDSA